MGFSKFELDSVCHVGVTLPIHAVSPLSLRERVRVRGFCGSGLARERGGSVDLMLADLALSRAGSLPHWVLGCLLDWGSSLIPRVF